MTCSIVPKAILLASATWLVSACGGGGGSIASAPPPPPQTVPPAQPVNDTSVELLENPATQEFAITTHDDPIQIRFDASRNLYEIKTSSFDWTAVADPPDPSGGSPNQYFLIAGQPDTAYFRIVAHHREPDPDRKYRYSNLAAWQPNNDSGREFGNFVAFGTPTPTSGVPLTGSASFAGFAKGVANIPNDAWGPTQATPLEGTVKLNFDFAAGSLSGSLALATQCDCTKPVSTGLIGFSDTLFARGSQTFSGKFATGVAGTNSFEGRFTGPGAEELIASWTLPFSFEGNPHQAWGAWIAKRGN